MISRCGHAEILDDGLDDRIRRNGSREPFENPRKALRFQPARLFEIRDRAPVEDAGNSGDQHERCQDQIDRVRVADGQAQRGEQGKSAKGAHQRPPRASKPALLPVRGPAAALAAALEAAVRLALRHARRMNGPGRSVHPPRPNRFDLSLADSVRNGAAAHRHGTRDYAVRMVSMSVQAAFSPPRQGWL